MNINERLNIAYENVAYNGDNTWTNGSYIYQKANLDLYTREQQLRLLKYSQLRPRSVKESIPTSKLAQYDNYTYNEARELSYNANISRYFTPLRISEELCQNGYEEPWMLPEIDDLYVWFLNYRKEILNYFIGTK
ncbi:unnamed protein product [Brassicogethes aeneus]|uniref:Uncharacterized protein n=1 Tax=Brassicogethes aeneus TaxID=1431903 RepID=A0A9P0FEZ9_BRAAE|nr:unnamed protein product [Brassicogethes aeneus]